MCVTEHWSVGEKQQQKLFFSSEIFFASNWIFSLDIVMLMLFKKGKNAPVTNAVFEAPILFQFFFF
jgi:hypothetical protein